MSLGFIMYFYYGITHSSLEQTTDELELHVDKDYVSFMLSRTEDVFLRTSICILRELPIVCVIY